MLICTYNKCLKNGINNLVIMAKKAFIDPELVIYKHNELIKFVKSINMERYVAIQYYYDTLAEHFGCSTRSIRLIICNEIRRRREEGKKIAAKRANA